MPALTRRRRFGQQAAQPSRRDAPASVLKKIGRDRRRQHRGSHHDDRKDPPVPEKRQPERAEQGARGVEHVARLARVETERLKAMVQVEPVRRRHLGALPAAAEDRPSGVRDRQRQRKHGCSEGEGHRDLSHAQD